MKNLLKYTFALCALVAACACTEEGELDPISVNIERDSYTVAPLARLEIPFTVANSGGSASAAVVSSDESFDFTAVMSGPNTGTILFIAPDVATEERSATATLTVTGSTPDRVAAVQITVTVSSSDAIAAAFEHESYSLIAEAGDVVELAYDVTGLGYAAIADLQVSTTNNWSVLSSADGVVELEVPAGSSETVVSLTVTDNYGRQAAATASVSLREILALTERANCHLIPTGSFVRFDASHRGNSDAEEDRLYSVTADLLWQDAKGLVQSVAFDAATATVLVETAPGISGNAVVATRDLSGSITWSWHIWVTDYNPAAGAFAVRNTVNNPQMSWVYMNRDLGATTDDWKSVNFSGNYYQWGRKDPFPGLGDHDANTARAIYDINNQEIRLDQSFVETTDNLDNSILNPTVFYKNSNASVGDWYTTVVSTHNNDLWGAMSHGKTIYDPCPAGWRVPENDYLTQGLSGTLAYCGYFTQLKGDGEGVDVDRYADDYHVAVFTLGSDAWYFPYSGWMSSGSGQIGYASNDGIGQYAKYWSANPYKTASSTYAYTFVFSTFLNGGKANNQDLRGNGQSVRCVLDQINPFPMQ